MASLKFDMPFFWDQTEGIGFFSLSFEQSECIHLIIYFTYIQNMKILIVSIYPSYRTWYGGTGIYLTNILICLGYTTYSIFETVICS